MVAIRSKSRPDEGQRALEALRKTERVNPHRWDEDERQLLTILYRFYEAAHSTTIPQVFNAITNLELRHNIVKDQFEHHLKLYGGRAFPEFGRVMAVPFDDHEGHYNDIHSIIEDAASKLGVQLSKRQTEVKFTSGAAQWAKSPRTRRAFKSLVRRAAQKEKDGERESLVQMPEFEATPLPALHAWNNEDVEDSPSSLPTIIPVSQRRIPTSHSIAFRVWDSESRTKFTEEDGFESEMCSDWRGQFLPPFTPEGEGMQAIKLLTNSHLSKSGGKSAFVSVSTSLLQVLVKASAMDNPRIAVGT
jgi:hypothetical protein